MIIKPLSQIEWFLRYAFKVSQFSSEGVRSESLTDLWMTNLRFELFGSLDIIGEYRLFYQHDTNDYEYGTSLETGYVIG